jgi:predicted nucleotidyltransferase
MRVADIQNRILPILREHGVRRAGVFGSRARGEERPDSDLDLLVELESGRSLFDLAGLGLDLSERLGVRAHVVTYRSLHHLLRDRILADEVPLLR